MPLTYLIDGYNLIHALGMVRKQIAPKELETARRRLLDFLRERLEPLADEIIVIFDAKRKPGHVPTEYQEGRIQVRYAGRDEQADDVIETLLAEHPAPNRLAVISDDQRLRHAATRRHALSWGCQDLLEHLEKSAAPAPEASPSAANERKLSGAEVQEWLREFGDVELPNEFRDFLDPPASND
jgi:predicted RNA-binding protein with PIN domain